MKGTRLITFLYIVILFIQYFLRGDIILTDNFIKLKNNITYNNQNKKKLETFLNNSLTDKYNKLNEFNDFNMWIDELNKKNDITFDIENNNQKYYIFVYKKYNDNFINLVHQNKDYIGLTFQDIIQDSKKMLEYSSYNIDDELVKNMYEYKKKYSSYPSINYYWIDPYDGLIVKKKSFFKSFKYNDIEGIIGIGYNNNEVSIRKNSYYYNLISPIYLILGSLLSFLISIILINSNTKYNKIKSIVTLISLNIFIYFFINQKEFNSTINFEQNQLETIISNNLSLSFLTAVTIFILGSIQGVQIYLYRELYILFILAIFFILVTQYSSTNFTSISKIRKIRINKQFSFNYGLIINCLILLLFFIYIIEEIFNIGKKN